jgi:hypothetical protein
MGRIGYSRRGPAQSATPGSTRRPRGEGRLDPVRWRRPGRGTLLRLAAVAALLATAAAVLWSSPPGQACNPTTGGVGAAARSGAAAPLGGAASSGAGSSSAGSSGAGSSGAAQGSGSGAAKTTPGASAASPGAGEGGRPGSEADPAVPDGRVGVPIRLADPTALSLVRPGNRVDLLRVGDGGGQPTAVAGSALVLRVTGADDPTTGGLLLALSPQEANRAVMASRQGFAIVIRPG